MLSPSSRVPILLSLVLLPAMVLTSGCIFFLSLVGAVRVLDSTEPIIADDASYYRPPDEFFWKWLPRVARREPKTGKVVLVERSTKLDTPLLISDLRMHLKEVPSATAVTYFSEHGMACKPAGADTECAYTMAASFICSYIVDEKPQPPDYATRYPGRVRLAIKLSTDNVVKSAHAIVEATDKRFICPPRR
jgi:hypothetical protein